MLLTLDLSASDDAGNLISSCSILKCHKREGDEVHCGDPLFDIEVSEILVPLETFAEWSNSQFFHQYSFEIASFVERRLAGRSPASNGAGKDAMFSLSKTSYRQILALDSGILSEVYAPEGVRRKIGEPMALLTTGQAGEVNSSSPAAPCRIMTRSLALHDVLQHKSRAAAAKGLGSRQYVSGGSVILWSEKAQPDRRIGIFAKGGCDLPSLKACWPLIDKVLQGTCCLSHEGVISDGRNDQLLQTLRDDLPWDAVNEVIGRLNLQRHTFEPRIFQKTFSVDGPNGPEEFPMNVVILGSGSDLNRTLYRHREHGFLVDPGSAWLDRVDAVLNDLASVTWFRRTFASIGKVTPSQYMENLSKVIQEIRNRNGAQVLVFNNLNVEPKGLAHNYQFMSNVEIIRRLEFKLALTEVSRNLSVPIIDVDRIAKKAGIGKMLDIAHFPATITTRIAEEIFGILRDLNVF